MARHTINSHDWARLARVGTICGFDIHKLLDDIDVTVSESADPIIYWDIGALTRLNELAIARSTHAHFPFQMGEDFIFDRAPEVEAFIATSATVREVIDLLHYLPALLQPELSFRYEVDGPIARISADLQGLSGKIYIPGFIESVFVVLLRIIEQLLQHPVHISLTFRHQPLTTLSAYHQQFQTIPDFGAAENTLSIPARYLDEPLQAKSPAMHARAQLLVEAKVKQVQSNSGLEKTLYLLLTHTPELNIAQACSQLGLEPRSLQRKLQSAQTSFVEIQSRVRYQLAQRMLLDSSLDLDSIAIKLGFADRNSLSKAFTKWHGSPPIQFRRDAIK